MENTHTNKHTRTHKHIHISTQMNNEYMLKSKLYLRPFTIDKWSEINKIKSLKIK